MNDGKGENVAGVITTSLFTFRELFYKVFFLFFARATYDTSYEMFTTSPKIVHRLMVYISCASKVETNHTSVSLNLCENNKIVTHAVV